MLIPYAKVIMAIQNKYFDVKEFSEQPLKDCYKTLIFTQKPALAQTYYLMVSKNQALQNDSCLLTD